MNSLDIPRFLPSFLFACWVCFCCVFSNPHSRRLYGNHFSTLSLLPLLLYASLFFTCSPTIICLQV
ncbi:hypothetical protein BKA57DRAFT_461714, partial [Linnemannia elongata]